MSETALKFGPEWVRALSHGGSVNSPPPSPGLNKYKLADHRYGREEMLALFDKHQSPPDGILALGPLYLEHPQDPLALIPMNEDEQRMWQRGVNSDAVLRQTGRPPVNGVGRGRGGSVDRGRGRGRGTGSYYSRGLSYDEEAEPRGPREGGTMTLGMGIRSKPFERSQSVHEQRAWSERGTSGPVGTVGGTSGTEDRNGAISPRKEQGRASTENWRSRGSENDETERWRGVGSGRSEKWGARCGWRERENGLDGDWDDGSGRGTGRGVPVTSRSTRQPWDDKDGHHRKSWEEDNLPEWATENADEKGGSFDASGAFHGPGWSDEEEPSAENRGGGRPRHKSTSPDKTVRGRVTVLPKPEMGKKKNETEQEERSKNSGSPSEPGQEKSLPNAVGASHESGSSRDLAESQRMMREDDSLKEEMAVTNSVDTVSSSHASSPLINGISGDEDSSREMNPAEGNDGSGTVPGHQTNSPVEPLPEEQRQGEEEKLEHMRSVADDLVAKLVEEDDMRPQAGGPSQGVAASGPMGAIVESGSHASQIPGEDKWYYTDPQGEVQGPFSCSDMAEWYKAGYFTSNLLLKRECDDQFAQLGELTRVFARVPFLPGPPVPPLKLAELLAAQKQQAERERIELLQNYMLQQQVYQHQMAISRQQVLQKLQSMDEWSSLNQLQQQQLFMQHMMNVLPAHPPVPPTVPPSTTPPAAIPTTTQVSAAGPDPRVMPGHVPPPVSKPQDPIQALVAQMVNQRGFRDILPQKLLLEIEYLVDRNAKIFASFSEKSLKSQDFVHTNNVS